MISSCPGSLKMLLAWFSLVSGKIIFFIILDILSIFCDSFSMQSKWFCSSNDLRSEYIKALIQFQNNLLGGVPWGARGGTNLSTLILHTHQKVPWRMQRAWPCCGKDNCETVPYLALPILALNPDGRQPKGDEGLGLRHAWPTQQKIH